MKFELKRLFEEFRYKKPQQFTIAEMLKLQFKEFVYFDRLAKKRSRFKIIVHGIVIL